MVSSFFKSSGLTFLYSNPILNPSGQFTTIDVTERLISYQHSIQIDGGFESATIGLASNQEDVDDWLENGLGRHIEVRDEASFVAWEGFVNQINAKIGRLTITVGPLLGIANRASVTYTPYIDVTVDPPTTGAAAITTINENLESQGKFGIFEDIVSGGTLMDDATYCGASCTPDNEAEEIRDAYLADMAWPETSQQLTIGDAGSPSLTVECVGYYRLLEKYVYESTTLNTVQIPTKLQSILAFDPNSIFSTDYSNIATAAAYLLLVPAYEGENRFAKAIIDEMVAMGDANDNRTYFAIYEGRKAYYSAIPTTVEYSHYVLARDQDVYYNQRRLKPWEVRPAHWMRIPDLLIGRRQETELRKDPRNMLIESVEYTAPYTIAINGKKVNKVSQLLAKRGS